MIVIVGAGVAGLACALAAVKAGGEVELVTPGLLSAGGVEDGAPSVDVRRAGGNTALAQGGIAAAIGDQDRAVEHLADTMAAGVGLVDPEAARVLTRDGAAAVRSLIAQGLEIDRDLAGEPDLGLEAAHGRARIVHAGGDRTGAVLHRYLTEQVLSEVAAGTIVLREMHEAMALRITQGAVTGVELRDARSVCEIHTADAVVLATGGYAALYPRTSNHAGARGEGVVLAARAGALVSDLEFIQFHPTVIDGTGELVSEAVRGAGGVLRDAAGKRFMESLHPSAELAPRDVVSREIHRLLQRTGDSCVWLDATGVERQRGAGALAHEFPGITRASLALGFDWTREPIPVSPAAHYSMGGVVSDLVGRSTVPGLFVAGEVAATGVHGANRLASNSLLEGLVFGARAGAAASSYAGNVSATTRQKLGGRRGDWEFDGRAVPALSRTAHIATVNCRARGDAGTSRAAGTLGDDGASLSTSATPVDNHENTRVSLALADGLGIERDAVSLQATGRIIRAESGHAAELAAMIHTAATARTESRGAHQRADYPETMPHQASRQAFQFIFPGSGPGHDSIAGSVEGSFSSHPTASTAHERDLIAHG